VCCRGPRRDTQLGEQGAHVRLHAARADHELCRRCSFRPRPAQHPRLAPGHPGRPHAQRLGQFG
jgi:hypothetical protein